MFPRFWVWEYVGEEPSRWHIISFDFAEEYRAYYFWISEQNEKNHPKCFVLLCILHRYHIHLFRLWRSISIHIPWTKKRLAESSLISFYRRFQPASQVTDAGKSISPPLLIVSQSKTLPFSRQETHLCHRFFRLGCSRSHQKRTGLIASTRSHTRNTSSMLSLCAQPFAFSSAVSPIFVQTRPPPLSGETLTAKSNFRVHTGIRFSIKPNPLLDVSLPLILSIVPLPTTIYVTLDPLPLPRRPMSISPYPQTKLASQGKQCLDRQQAKLLCCFCESFEHAK